jgi:hypothetical protein
MYMLETYKGLASGIIYASKGDEVKVIRIEDQLTFVEFNGEKFHVQNNKLSDVKIDADKEQSEPLPTIEKATKSKNSKSKPITQSQLF